MPQHIFIVYRFIYSPELGCQWTDCKMTHAVLAGRAWRKSGVRTAGIRWFSWGDLCSPINILCFKMAPGYTQWYYPEPCISISAYNCSLIFIWIINLSQLGFLVWLHSQWQKWDRFNIITILQLRSILHSTLGQVASFTF